ncbi:MAG: 2-dehydropantoate 2-reductase [Bacteroidaceae bacterium]
MEKIKFAIAGAGGVGGSIAAMLSLAGEDVTCIARNSHLQTMQERGLTYKSDLKGNHLLRIPTFSAEEYQDKVDVIFVCVKGYSITSIIDLIKRISHQGTLVIPILNVYGTGPKIASLLPDNIRVIDGCIYIVGFKSAPGEITQMGKIFHMVYGARHADDFVNTRMEEVANILRDAGIKVTISDDINRDTFVKWSFISAMAVTGLYYDCTMKRLQDTTDEAYKTFYALSSETEELGKSLGIHVEGGLLNHNLHVMSKLDPNSTASMQKDMAAGNQTEIKGQLFDVIALADKQEVAMPHYQEVAKKFK